MDPTDDMRKHFTSDGSPARPDLLDTVGGSPIEIIFDQQHGDTHWQVFRPSLDGKLRVVIRQETGFVEVTVKNVEKLIAKLAQMRVPYETW